MRLQELYHTIKEKYRRFPDAHIIYTQTQSNEVQQSDSKNKSAEFINLYSVYRYLLSLEELPGFQDAAPKLLELIGYTGVPVSKSRYLIAMEDAATVQSYLDGVRFSVLSLKALCEKIGIDEKEHGFDIKLPPNVTLRDLSVLIKNLDSVFSQCPLFSKADGYIAYSGVDVGSAWLTFVVGGAGAIYILNRLAEFVDKCIIIRSHWLTCKQQEEMARKLELSNDVLDGLKNYNHALLEKIKEQALNELAASNDITDPEDNERLKYSINLFIEQMNKGMEIYASVGASQEIKAAFPAIETQALPDTALKMLTDSDNSESVTI